MISEFYPLNESNPIYLYIKPNHVYSIKDPSFSS